MTNEPLFIRNNTVQLIKTYEYPSNTHTNKMAAFIEFKYSLELITLWDGKKNERYASWLGLVTLALISMANYC